MWQKRSRKGKIKFRTNGGWRYYIEKVSPETVYVSALRSEVKSASASVGAGLMSLSTGALNDESSGMSFEFDLADTEAMMAYEDLLKGNMVPAQEMAQDIFNPAVQHIEDIELLLSGKRRSFIFGLPYMNVRTSKGEFYSYSNVDFIKQGLKTVTEYGIFSKEVRGRFWLKHRNHMKVFAGGIATTTDKTGAVVAQDNKVQLSWFYEKDYADSKHVNRAVEDLLQDTGMTDLAVKVNKTKDLGYVNVKLDIEGDRNFTNVLMNLSRRNGSFRAMENDMSTLVTNYFNQGDKLELCNNDQSVSSCKSSYMRRSKKALAKIKSFGAKLAKLRKTDSKAFAKTFSEIGEQVWKNQFVFKAVLNKLKSCGVEMNYEVSGERISNYQVQEVTAYDPNACK